jgi:hypothetical protein
MQLSNEFSIFTPIKIGAHGKPKNWSQNKEA